MSRLFFSVLLFMACSSALVASLKTESADLVVGLRPHRVDELETLFWSISDPQSPMYAQYLSQTELAALTGATDEEISIVQSWLKKLGASSVQVSATRDAIVASLPAHTTTALANLFFSKTSDDAQSMPLSAALKVDEKIAAIVDVMVPKSGGPLSHRMRGHARPRHPRLRRSPRNPATPGGDPNSQKKQYGIPLNLTGTNPRNLQMVWGPGTFGFTPSDLSLFYSEFNIGANVNDITVTGYPGVPGGDNFGEGTLDTTYITSFAPGVRLDVSNTDNSSSAEEGPGFGPAILNWAVGLSNLTDDQLPLVVSVSLGSLTSDSCNILCEQVASAGSISYSDCLNYMQYTQRQVCMFAAGDIEDRTNVEFMKLGARGVSIFAATGDGGSHYSFQPFPSDKIGSALNNVSCIFNSPTFPASSPYVTGVGGTQYGNNNQFVPWIASGSGFSWRFAQPKYQQSVVNAYIAAQSSSASYPPSFGYNATGRAYPDVAALANDVPMVSGGSTFYAGGTSASTPTFAGIISLLNDHRLNNNLPPLGFINPRLYQAVADHPGEILFDMTTGSSACADDGSCCSTGFPSAVGWDPNTGLGSPLWNGLLKYLGSDSHLSGTA